MLIFRQKSFQFCFQAGGLKTQQQKKIDLSKKYYAADQKNGGTQLSRKTRTFHRDFNFVHLHCGFIFFAAIFLQMAD